MLEMSYENKLWSNYNRVCGVDEVGRGPLAGPVVAAAVVFPKNFQPEGILTKTNDSKRLSKKLRNELNEAIKVNALEYKVAEIGPTVIDEINILNATIEAMQTAIKNLSSKPDFLLIDGISFNDNLKLPYKTIKSGDRLVFSIAAASILAKVYRDNLMSELDKVYPAYGFKNHFGYGTKSHIEVIKSHGRTEIHRKSFKLSTLGEK